MLASALLAGFLLQSLFLASFRISISLVLMMPAIFSLLLSPQHCLSGVADSMRAVHIRDCLCLHEPESLNDFIVLLNDFIVLLEFC